MHDKASMQYYFCLTLSSLLIMSASVALMPNLVLGALSDTKNESIENNPLDIQIDFSSINKETTIEEAFEVVRRRIPPSLSIVVMWNYIDDNTFIDPDSPVEVDGIGKTSLKNGLDIILRSLSDKQGFEYTYKGRKYKRGAEYAYKDGIIVISSNERPSSGAKINDVSGFYGSDGSCEKQLNTLIDFSSITKETTLDETLSFIRSQKIPGLSVVVLWNSLAEKHFEKDTESGIEGLGRTTLRQGLDLISQSVSSDLFQIIYTAKEGMIVVKARDDEWITLLGIDSKPVLEKPEFKKVHEKLLNTRVDISSFKTETTFEEAIKLLRRQTKPPLQITTPWDETLSDDYYIDVDPDCHVGFDGLSNTTLKNALELILESANSDAVFQVIYRCKEGGIIIETDPARLNHRMGVDFSGPYSYKKGGQNYVVLLFRESGIYLLNEKLNSVKDIPEALKKLDEPEKTTINYHFWHEDKLDKAVVETVMKNIKGWARQAGLKGVSYRGMVKGPALVELVVSEKKFNLNGYKIDGLENVYDDLGYEDWTESTFNATFSDPNMQYEKVEMIKAVIAKLGRELKFNKILFSDEGVIDESRVSELIGFGYDQAVDWLRYDSDAISEDIKKGRPVLVKFTADWCTTSMAINKQVYNDKDVADILKQKGVRAYLADATGIGLAKQDLKMEYKEDAVPVTIIHLPGGKEKRLRGRFDKSELVKILQSLNDVAINKSAAAEVIGKFWQAMSIGDYELMRQVVDCDEKELAELAKLAKSDIHTSSKNVKTKVVIIDVKQTSEGKYKVNSLILSGDRYISRVSKLVKKDNGLKVDFDVSEYLGTIHVMRTMSVEDFGEKTLRKNLAKVESIRDSELEKFKLDNIRFFEDIVLGYEYAKKHNLKKL